MLRELREGIAIHARVVSALILRDMQTRFGRTFFGYVIIVGWPLSHLLGIMGAYLLASRVAPIGTSTAVFLATGILPYILCLYPARMIMMCIVQNHPLLYFPIVKVTDVVLARGILEVLTAFWVTGLFVLILFISGVDVTPLHYQDAVAAILATILFGFSAGFLGAILYKLTRAWLAAQIGLMILMYVSAGVFFIPTSLPEDLQSVVWYNPLLHSVEWLRSAYYDGYGYGMLSPGYLIGVSMALLLTGLLVERLVRGKLLEH